MITGQDCLETSVQENIILLSVACANGNIIGLTPLKGFTCFLLCFIIRPSEDSKTVDSFIRETWSKVSLCHVWQLFGDTFLSFPFTTELPLWV